MTMYYCLDWHQPLPSVKANKNHRTTTVIGFSMLTLDRGMSLKWRRILVLALSLSKISTLSNQLGIMADTHIATIHQLRKSLAFQKLKQSRPTELNTVLAVNTSSLLLKLEGARANSDSRQAKTAPLSPKSKRMSQYFRPENPHQGKDPSRYSDSWRDHSYPTLTTEVIIKIIRGVDVPQIITTDFQVMTSTSKADPSVSELSLPT